MEMAVQHLFPFLWSAGCPNSQRVDGKPNPSLHECRLEFGAVGKRVFVIAFDARRALFSRRLQHIFWNWNEIEPCYPLSSMTESDVIRAMREYLEGLFPKSCPSCRRTFATLREYLSATKHQGPPMPYDAELGDWNPLRPVGTVTFSNCPCGTTLVLSSINMPLSQLWRLLSWARIETRRRGMSPQELLSYLRDEICKQVLAEPEGENH